MKLERAAAIAVYSHVQLVSCRVPRSEKLDVVRLTFYTAPVSLACLLPFYWLYEVRCGCACGMEWGILSKLAI